LHGDAFPGAGPAWRVAIEYGIDVALLEPTSS
jgi:hypothetical protein